MEEIEAFILFTPKEEVQLFAIIQEAFSNIHKHAEASAVTLELIGSRDDWRLRIMDNGKGLTHTEGTAQKYGIVMMRERAKQLKAGFLISRREQGGTELIVEKERFR
ncbi:Sensor protein VraS [compost metagenome]